MNVTLESGVSIYSSINIWIQHQALSPAKNSIPSPVQKWLPGVKLILFFQIWGGEVFAQSCLARRKIMGFEDERLYWPSEDGPQSGKAVFDSIFNSRDDDITAVGRGWWSSIDQQMEVVCFIKPSTSEFSLVLEDNS